MTNCTLRKLLGGIQDGVSSNSGDSDIDDEALGGGAISLLPLLTTQMTGTTIPIGAIARIVQDTLKDRHTTTDTTNAAATTDSPQEQTFLPQNFGLSTDEIKSVCGLLDVDGYRAMEALMSIVIGARFFKSLFRSSQGELWQNTGMGAITAIPFLLGKSYNIEISANKKMTTTTSGTIQTKPTLVPHLVHKHYVHPFAITSANVAYLFALGISVKIEEGSGGKHKDTHTEYPITHFGEFDLSSGNALAKFVVILATLLKVTNLSALAEENTRSNNARKYNNRHSLGTYAKLEKKISSD